MVDNDRARTEDEILARLRSAQGHLQAVVHMAEGGAPVEDVLPQLRSVEAALAAAGRRMIQAQLRCGGDALARAASADERAAEAERLMRLWPLAARRLKTGR